VVCVCVCVGGVCVCGVCVVCCSAALESQRYSYPRGVRDMYTVRVHGI